ncbi:MAG: hypothetical protein ACE5K8_09370 [Candidatus Zixiibacteriota bacterium]
MRTLQQIILVLILASAPTAKALERGAIELGADASMSYFTISPGGTFTLDLPDQIRAGVFVARNTAVVSRLATVIVNPSSGHQSANSYALGITIYKLSPGQRSAIVFEAMGLVDFLTGRNKGSQFGIGFGAGFQGLYRAIHPRVELVAEYRFESEFVSTSTIKVLFGFSFYGTKK